MPTIQSATECGEAHIEQGGIETVTGALKLLNWRHFRA